jgi:hypothetical protein
MKAHSFSAGVSLPSGHTGSSLFHQILRDTVERHPQALAEAALPESPDAFKRDYGRVLARFEAARAASPRRADIARTVVERSRALFVMHAPGSPRPLADTLAEPVPAGPSETQRFSGPAGLAVAVSAAGKLLSGRALTDWVDALHAAHHLNEAARRALHWMVERERAAGPIDLRGQRFVLFGAGAELAPTRQLLRAGASVLWVDLSDPSRALLGELGLSGDVCTARDARNLLEQPREIAAQIRAFAAAGPVHVGMFAYAPGSGKEWRLGVAMDAIVKSLPPGMVRSISMLISPTTPSILGAEGRAVHDARSRALPGWQRALGGIGLVKAPGYVSVGEACSSLSTVSLQGVSYQAAQYVSKLAAAETYAVHGLEQGAAPIAVSANVAGVTRTRSLAHPLFQAAFAGASRFGVRIFEPETTRALSALLMLHDLLNVAAPGSARRPDQNPAEKASAVLSQRIDGGIHTLPFALERVIQVAALVGMAAHPSLLFPAKREKAIATERRHAPTNAAAKSGNARPDPIPELT